MGQDWFWLDTQEACLVKLLTFRICARLETKGHVVIKGIQLEGLRVVGEVSTLANNYYESGADELILTDVTSSWFSTQSTVSVLSNLVSKCFIPITIGGGIRSIEDVDNCLRAGAERVSINTSSFQNPELLIQVARKYGKQSVVLHIQAKRFQDNFLCYYGNGRENSTHNLVSFLNNVPMEFVGEILLNSIDQDGTNMGPDLDLVKITLNNSSVPVIYAGGVAKVNDVARLIELNCHGVALSSSLHSRNLRLDEIKNELHSQGFPVRLVSNA
jgi:cyclase